MDLLEVHRVNRPQAELQVALQVMHPVVLLVGPRMLFQVNLLAEDGLEVAVILQGKLRDPLEDPVAISVVDLKVTEGMKSHKLIGQHQRTPHPLIHLYFLNIQLTHLQ